MRKVLLNLPTFGMAVVTRAALGAGLGLLLAERIGPGLTMSRVFVLNFPSCIVPSAAT